MGNEVVHRVSGALHRHITQCGRRKGPKMVVVGPWSQVTCKKCLTYKPKAAVANLPAKQLLNTELYVLAKAYQMACAADRIPEESELPADAKMLARYSGWSPYEIAKLMAKKIIEEFS